MKPAMSSTQLAIDGGTPVRLTPFNPWPHLSAEDLAAADRVLRSGKINYWTGDEGTRFEAEYAHSVGTKHAVALANGTVALELALRVLGVGPGDEVITTSRTFVASASCSVAVGATPVTADVDRNSGNLTAETILPLINARTKALVAVHLAGWPCEMDSILKLASEHGIAVIEDCAQAHGATYKNRPVGSMGIVNAFSFCQDKIITTAGEGGLITLNDDAMFKQAWAHKDHGKSHDAVFNRKHPAGFRWLHESFGTNFRLTEVQSAMGRTMLARLPEMVERRRSNAQTLIDELSQIPSLRVPVPGEELRHAYYKFYAYVRPEMLRDGWDRDRIVAAIAAEGIPCMTGSCSEIYLEKAFTASLRPKQRYPVARELGETSLMFLVHPTLDRHDMEDTVAAVAKVMAAAAK